MGAMQPSLTYTHLSTIKNLLGTSTTVRVELSTALDVGSRVQSSSVPLFKSDSFDQEHVNKMAATSRLILHAPASPMRHAFREGDLQQ